MTSHPSRFEKFRLTSAHPLGGTRVALVFADGTEFHLDLEPDLSGLGGPLAEPLRDPAVFSRLSVESGSLLFPTGLDYGGDVLRLWCEHGRVLDQTATDLLASTLHPAAA
jgi:hypothetical protein